MEFNEDTGQTALTGCRTQPDKGTEQASLRRVSPFYPFILLFCPHLLLHKQPPYLPVILPLNIPQSPNALPLHPVHPQPASGASLPLTRADRCHPWPTGRWLPRTALARAGAHFSGWVIGAAPPASVSVLLCVHAWGDKPSRVGCSPVMDLGVAGSGYHPGSPPTLVPLSSSVHAQADRLLNHVT